MRRIVPFVGLLGLLASFAFGATAASGQSGQAGSVFTLSNSTGGNAVLVYGRAPDGTLTPRGSYPTGGVGTGGGLGSQGALVLSDDRRWLAGVNAGSNSVSLFAVRSNGLELVETAPTGSQPISVTIHDRLLYVLDAGSGGSITGFTIDRDGLTPIAGSTRPLGVGGSAPAQVAFSPDGDTLVVTEKGSSSI